MNILQLPAMFGNAANYALEQVSEAADYDLKCKPAETENEINRPTEVETSRAELIHLCDRKIAGQKAVPSLTKKTQPKLERSKPAQINRKKPSSPGPRSQKQYYRAKAEADAPKVRKAISRKVHDARRRRESWSPTNIARNNWEKLSTKQQKEVIEKLENWVHTGSVKALEWLQWNIPKLGYKALCLALSQDTPDVVLDGFRVADMVRDVDRFYTEVYPKRY